MVLSIASNLIVWSKWLVFINAGLSQRLMYSVYSLILGNLNLVLFLRILLLREATAEVEARNISLCSRPNQLSLLLVAKAEYQALKLLS